MVRSPNVHSPRVAVSHSRTEPQLEGVNANKDLAAIYFRDPFLAYAYLGSIPFFVGIYQAIRFLGYAGRDEASSQATNAGRRTSRAEKPRKLRFDIFISLS